MIAVIKEAAKTDPMTFVLVVVAIMFAAFALGWWLSRMLT